MFCRDTVRRTLKCRCLSWHCSSNIELQVFVVTLFQHWTTGVCRDTVRTLKLHVLSWQCSNTAAAYVFRDTVRRLQLQILSWHCSNIEAAAACRDTVWTLQLQMFCRDTVWTLKLQMFVVPLFKNWSCIICLFWHCSNIETANWKIAPAEFNFVVFCLATIRKLQLLFFHTCRCIFFIYF